jgi:hypothetical protein
MKLFKLYLGNGGTYEVLAFRLSQATAAAPDRVVGFVAYAEWSCGL